AHRFQAVVDPVMIAGSGTALLDRDAIPVLARELLPRARLFTPNIPEAEALLQKKLGGVEDRVEAARALKARGARAVLLKGGHAEGDPIDVFVGEGDRVLALRGERIETRA